MTIHNPDGSLACICHEHRPVCGCVSSPCPVPAPLPGRRGWIVVALFVLVAFALAGHAMAMRGV
jgi:hypothetical protein